MASLVSIVGEVALQQVIEKSFFGGPYGRLGRLVAVIGTWVFQEGGALGYGLRSRPLLLSKLIARDPAAFIGQPRDMVTDLKYMADEHVAVAGDDRGGFLDFYAKPVLAIKGVDITAMPPDRRMDKKVKGDQVFDFMMCAWLRGTTVGYHYPDLFREVWKQNYETAPQADWAEMRAHLLALRLRQEERPFTDTISLVADSASWYAMVHAPGLLDTSELGVLDLLTRRPE